MTIYQQLGKNIEFNTSRNTCLGFDPQYVFYEAIRINQDLEEMDAIILKAFGQILCLEPTSPFLHIILFIKEYLQQQVHCNGDCFGNKCCRCNDGTAEKVWDDYVLFYNCDRN